MPSQQLSLAFFLFHFLLKLVNGQSGTISVGPLLACTAITFRCPGVNGCCTIAGCCGNGCCANGYTCINEGTSAQVCCPASDPTKCGTAKPSSASSSDTRDCTCTRIDNCPRDPVRGLAWTCLLGKRCGLSYGECYPCPYIGGCASSKSTSVIDSYSSSSIRYGSSSTSAVAAGNTPISGSGSSSSSSSSSGRSPSGSRICRSHEVELLLAMGFVLVAVS